MTVSINSGANSLATGSYSDTVTFAIHRFGADIELEVTLVEQADPSAFEKALRPNTKLIMLDMAALEQGKIKVLQEAVITGKPKDASGGTITFSTSFSVTATTQYILRADFASLSDGDRVTVGVSPYDPERGIITFRAR